MEQLGLNIRPCLAYSADNFILHKGAASVFEGICACLSLRERFRIVLAAGGKRSGKTHLSIKLAGWLTEKGNRPCLLEGEQLAKWMTDNGRRQFHQDDVLAIDDADAYLGGLVPGDSGPLVRLIESLRTARAGLVLFCSRPLDQYSFDDHIRSRLNAAAAFSLSHPAAADIPLLVEYMARQRGIAFKERMLEFIEKRVERTVPAIEAYLDRLGHLSQIIGKPIRFPLLNDAL